MLEKRELIELVALFRDSSLAELEWWQGNWRVRLVRGEEKATAAPAPDASAGVRMAASPAGAEATEGRHRHTVRAGMAGQFYRSPRPGEAPFVQVGSRIEAGATVGMMEAMKMLVPVEAECGGTVVAIMARDSAEVATGDPLITIEIDS